MNEIELLKAGAGLLSALGGIAVYKFNISQSMKARAELIEQFENSLAKNKKHATCELFRLIHGLRMDYDDIERLCESNQAIKIIYALRKTGGMVKYENGKFQYTNLFRKKWARALNKYIMQSLTYIMGGVTLLLIYYSTLLDGPESLIMMIFVIPSAAFFSMQVKDIRHDKMVESLVSVSET